jgi:hypothetical protein
VLTGTVIVGRVSTGGGFDRGRGFGFTTGGVSGGRVTGGRTGGGAEAPPPTVVSVVVVPGVVVVSATVAKTAATVVSPLSSSAHVSPAPVHAWPQPVNE